MPPDRRLFLFLQVFGPEFGFFQISFRNHSGLGAILILGGKEPTTLKELAASLGKETIDTYNTGESRGRETSHSLNYQKLGKDVPYLFVKSSVALNST